MKDTVEGSGRGKFCSTHENFTTGVFQKKFITVTIFLTACLPLIFTISTCRIGEGRIKICWYNLKLGLMSLMLLLPSCIFYATFPELQQSNEPDNKIDDMIQCKKIFEIIRTWDSDS